ncbi:MAG: TonB family protein [Methylobacter sp.]
MQKKRSLFAALSGEVQPRFMGGLLLVLVLLLHLWLGIWLLKPTELPKTPSPVVMEVSLVSSPSQKAEIAPPAPPKPVPPKPEQPKKQPVKQPVKKKMPTIPKQVELPKSQTITEEMPSLPAPAPAAPVSAPQPVSRPAPAAVSSEPKISTNVIPLERIPPKYPARAANRHIEGWVKIEFTITTSGTVEDAVVVEAQPAEVFDDSALKAINQWTFKEKIVDGVAVEQRAVQTLQFKLTR